jgi:hypothetical protein
MPLQNRVTPFSRIEAVPQRGLVTGNRGILHDDQRRLVSERRPAQTAKSTVRAPDRHDGPASGEPSPVLDGQTGPPVSLDPRGLRHARRRHGSGSVADHAAGHCRCARAWLSPDPAPNSHPFFRITQVVIERIPCTTVVLIGSSNSPPSCSVSRSSLASSTR